ncbi:MAG: efflux RND transporter periplasmic adaptor subunit [Alphaproteobacteria bacterium]|nr:efflux RND transporter periplasmic adaptor subunit [Alphaproteobacteria bacterium]
MGRKLVMVLCLIILILLFMIAKPFWGHKKSQEVLPKLVTTALVVERDMDQRIQLVGTVFPSENVIIKARVDSQITAIPFKNGDFVKEGDTLFELDDRVLKAQLQQAKANLLRDEAEVVRAKAHFERDEKLVTKGVSSKEQFDTSTQAFKAAEANVEATKAQINNLEAQLSYTKIKAPISGYTGTITLTVGNVVKANDAQPLVVINKLDPIRIQVAIPQEYFEDIRRGQQQGNLTADIMDQQGNLLASSVVTYKDNTLSEQTRTLDVHLVLDNKESKMWPGMFVNVALLLNTVPKAMVVPDVALQHGQNKQTFVYAVRNDKVVKIPVTLMLSDTKESAVKGDIRVGDQIITDGLLRVKEGDRVTVKNTQSSESPPEPLKGSS